MFAINAARNLIGNGVQAIGRAVAVEEPPPQRPQQERRVPPLPDQYEPLQQPLYIRDEDPNRDARRDLDRLQIEQEMLQRREEIAQMRARERQREREHEEGAFYTLCERMIGKRMDNTWQSFAVNVVSDYLDKNNILEPKQRYDIITRVKSRFLQHIEHEQHLTLTDILNIQDRNRDLAGEFDEVVWYNPLTWHKKVCISENTSGSWREHKLYSISQAMTVGLLGAGVILGARYCISKALPLLMPTSITHQATQQLMQPIQIAIPQLDCLSMSLNKLASFTDTLDNSSVIRVGSLDNSTSSALLIQLSERFIKTLGTGLSKAVELGQECVRSLK